MSLDFSLEMEVTEDQSMYSGNYTHNVTPMWSLAGIYEDLYNSEDKKAKDILKNLKSGLSKMKKSPAKFKKLNPENGWGSYETAMKFLEEIISACKNYPDAIIRISK